MNILSRQFKVYLRLWHLVFATFSLAGFASPASAQCLPNELQKLTGSDATFGDHFGTSVCILGDLAISGAPWANVEQYLAGAVYAYRQDPITSQWAEEQKIVPEDLGPLDWFGRSIDINPVNPNVIIVGAWANDDADDCGDNTVCESGSAYIFRFDPDLGLWQQEQKLTASDANSQDRFGWSVSIWGDVAIVGAKLDDDPIPQTGSAYIFRYNPETKIWIEQQKLIPPSLGRFGSSVTIQNDIAFVGAPVNFENGVEVGAVYYYHYDPQTQFWVMEQKLLPSDMDHGAGFGNSVSLSGDFALIGATFFNVNGMGGAGAAYIFEFSGAQWTERQLLTSSMPGSLNLFG